MSYAALWLMLSNARRIENPPLWYQITMLVLMAVALVVAVHGSWQVFRSSRELRESQRKLRRLTADLEDLHRGRLPRAS